MYCYFEELGGGELKEADSVTFFCILFFNYFFIRELEFLILLGYRNIIRKN